MPKAFTTDYEHFADPNLGLLPYIASSVKEVIKEENDEKLQKLIDDIAYVVDNLDMLLDEVEAAKTKYDQYRNKMKALETAMEEKQNALLAMQEEMRKEFGTDDDDDDAPELVFSGPDGDRVVKVSDEPPKQVMSEEMESFLDEMFTVENVTGKSMASAEDDLRSSGLIFNDEIDEAAANESIVDIDAPEEDDFYVDIDVAEPDVDNGYQPLDPFGSDDDMGFGEDFGDPFGSDDDNEYDTDAGTAEDTAGSLPSLGTADNVLAPDPDDEANMFLDILAEDGDFMNIFDEEDGDDDDDYFDSVVPDDDEYDTIDFDDTFSDGSAGGSDSSASSTSTPDSDDDDDDDSTTSGFVDPSFFS